MAKFGEDPSSLFRSLRPDDASFQASTAAAAREAEQRWPLFKTISPKKPAPTPALSIEERHHWSSDDRPSTEERKRALSVPGVSNKLAKSLSRMVTRPLPAATEQPSPLPAKRSLAGEAEGTSPKLVQKISGRDRDGLFAKAASAIPTRQGHESVKQPFGRIASPTAAPGAEMPVTTPADNSLSSIFKRLEKGEKAVAKPVRRQSTLMGRLGKR